MEQLGLCDHAALFYASRVEQMAAMVPFVHAGLARNERCIYIVDKTSIPLLNKHLLNSRIDVFDAQKRGALRILTADETYVYKGVFEPEQAVALFTKEAALAKKEGFSGLRATAEMSWALQLSRGLELLETYERKLNECFPGGCLGLCQFDTSLFPQDVIQLLAELHSVCPARNDLLNK